VGFTTLVTRGSESSTENIIVVYQFLRPTVEEANESISNIIFLNVIPMVVDGTAIGAWLSDQDGDYGTHCSMLHVCI
jgi:hypothetical protein